MYSIKVIEARGYIKRKLVNLINFLQLNKIHRNRRNNTTNLKIYDIQNELSHLSATCWIASVKCGTCERVLHRIDVVFVVNFSAHLSDFILNLFICNEHVQITATLVAKTKQNKQEYSTRITNKKQIEKLRKNKKVLHPDLLFIVTNFATFIIPHSVCSDS